MYNHVVGETVKNLAEGYKSKLGDLPPWWLEGLAHWLRREVSPHINLLEEDAGPEDKTRGDWDWARKVRKPRRKRQRSRRAWWDWWLVNGAA